MTPVSVDCDSHYYYSFCFSSFFSGRYSATRRVLLNTKYQWSKAEKAGKNKDNALAIQLYSRGSQLFGGKECCPEMHISPMVPFSYSIKARHHLRRAKGIVRMQRCGACALTLVGGEMFHFSFFIFHFSFSIFNFHFEFSIKILSLSPNRNNPLSSSYPTTRLTPLHFIT